MIPGREGLDAPEARVLVASCQHHVTIEPASAYGHLRKGHPDLERDPGFLRKNAHRPDGADRGDHRLEEGANFRRLSGEVTCQGVAATGVGLIPVGKDPSALTAAPEIGGGAGGTAGHGATTKRVWTAVVSSRQRSSASATSARGILDNPAIARCSPMRNSPVAGPLLRRTGARIAMAATRAGVTFASSPWGGTRRAEHEEAMRKRQSGPSSLGRMGLARTVTLEGARGTAP